MNTLSRSLASLLAVSASVLMVACCSTHTPKSSRAVNLFNGRDLSNWQSVLAKPEVKKEDVWSVRDGNIVCKGEPLGYICTDTKYTNFRLSVEWRWAPGKEPGNSGVFLRINGAPRGLPRCIEHQLKSGDAGDLYAFHGMKIDGDAARVIRIKAHELGGDLVGVKKLSANENPPGQWNRTEIVLQGGQLTVSVNGKPTNEARDCEIVAGPIGLQSEGGEVHFRTVQLVPLD